MFPQVGGLQHLQQRRHLFFGQLTGLHLAGSSHAVGAIHVDQQPFLARFARADKFYQHNGRRRHRGFQGRRNHRLGGRSRLKSRYSRRIRREQQVVQQRQERLRPGGHIGFMRSQRSLQQRATPHQLILKRIGRNRPRCRRLLDVAVEISRLERRLDLRLLSRTELERHRILAAARQRHVAIQKKLGTCIQTSHAARALIRHDLIRRRVDPQGKGRRLRSGRGATRHAGRGNPDTTNNRQPSKRQGSYDEDNGETVMLGHGKDMLLGGSKWNDALLNWAVALRRCAASCLDVRVPATGRCKTCPCQRDWKHEQSMSIPRLRTIDHSSAIAQHHPPHV